MSIHNYLRPLWSNGPHVVHDAPPTVRTAFELLFRGKPRRQGESIVQLHRVRPLDVTVAWLEVEVAMPVEGTGLSYRRARYLHAFAADGPGPDVLTARRARALFEDVYGEDLVAGVHAAQRSLIGLEHPARADRARVLFVGERRQPITARTSRDVATTAIETREGIGHVDSLVAPDPSRPDRAGEATPVCAPSRGPEPDDARLSTSAPTIFRDADLEAPILEARPASDRRTPVEAFDRALASRATASETRGPADPAGESLPLDRHIDEQASPPATADPSGESASLSTLLRARLVQRSAAEDPQRPTSTSGDQTTV